MCLKRGDSGAVARRVMGTTVIGGVLAATVVAIFLIPVTFYLVERIARARKKGTEEPATAPAALA